MDPDAAVKKERRVTLVLLKVTKEPNRTCKHQWQW